MVFYVMYICTGKAEDHITKVGRYLRLYNTLRTDGQNVGITKMRHMNSLTSRPYK